MRRRGACRGEAAARGAARHEEAAARRGALALDAVHRERDRPALARRELEIEFGAAFSQAGRSGRKAQPRTARPAVERGVVERHFVLRQEPRIDRAAPRAAVAADLEQVGKIGGEVEREAQATLRLGVARHREELVAGGFPEELGARDMERVLGEREVAFGVEEIRIGEIDVEHHVVRLHRRGEHHRPVSLEREAQAREKPRVVMKQPRRAVLDLEDVAELVEHGEAVAVLERAPARRRQRYDAGNQHRARVDFAFHAAATARRRASARYTER